MRAVSCGHAILRIHAGKGPAVGGPVDNHHWERSQGLDFRHVINKCGITLYLGQLNKHVLLKTFCLGNLDQSKSTHLDESR